MRQMLERIFLGRAALQPVFAKLHGLALAGMNFNRAWDVQTSGETTVLALLAKRLTGERPPVVFDVGANIGQYASAVLEAFRGHVDLHCFEPSAGARQRLASALAAWPQVRIHAIAVSNREGEAVLFADQQGSGLGSLHEESLFHQGKDAAFTERVQLQTLDAFCAQHAVRQIDLLKIDVEGHELSVLSGAKAMMAADAVGAIQFELSAAEIAGRVFFLDFFKLLSPRYKIYRIVRDGLVPIDGYNAKHEIFLTINYLALLERV